MVEGTLFVIRSGHTQHPIVLKAIEQIGRERILGVILNGVAPGNALEQYGYYAKTDTAANGTGPKGI
jgi:Mrp family chromosome partitioning ATPase